MLHFSSNPLNLYALLALLVLLSSKPFFSSSSTFSLYLSQNLWNEYETLFSLTTLNTNIWVSWNSLMNVYNAISRSLNRYQKFWRVINGCIRPISRYVGKCISLHVWCGIEIQVTSWSKLVEQEFESPTTITHKYFYSMINPNNKNLKKVMRVKEWRSTKVLKIIQVEKIMSQVLRDLKEEEHLTKTVKFVLRYIWDWKRDNLCCCPIRLRRISHAPTLKHMKQN